VWEAVEWHWRNAQAHLADLRRRAYADIESEL
jgi:hypothetical protein